ncbi:MAG TPA: arylsulfotransferase family protein [Gammaproteobacteria bacterium]|nr:arylsulfotransferase family protein [Gammaproteobacteria bacterium]
MRDSTTDRLMVWVFALSLAFLMFVVGALVAVAKVFPSSYIRDAYRGGTALYEKLRQTSDPLKTDMWMPARTTQRGVTVLDAARMQPGPTLYTSGHAAMALLIDEEGHLLHKWYRPYSSVWDETAAVQHPVPDAQVYFRKAELLPNGDLVAIYEGVGDTPYGYGLVRLDRDSHVVWKNLAHFHHDFSLGADGRIYALSQDFRKDQPKGVDHFSIPYLDDALVVLSPHGSTLKRLSLVDAINRSQYRRLLWEVPYYSRGDPLHANGVDVLGAAEAAALAHKLPVARAGQVLVSLREMGGGTVLLLDPRTGTVVWATRGPWLGQHDADVLANGDLMVFDNHGNFGEGGRSRVVEVDPSSGAVVWAYAGDRTHPLESAIRSSQQRLVNGNTLITESDGGRLLEVTTDGTVVWEYINPIRGGKADARIPVVCWGQRIDPETLTPGFLALISHPSEIKEVAKP